MAVRSACTLSPEVVGQIFYNKKLLKFFFFFFNEWRECVHGLYLAQRYVFNNSVVVVRIYECGVGGE